MRFALVSWALRRLRTSPNSHPCIVLTQYRPLALIKPAQSHPEVIVQAISARDRGRAEDFAKKHGIPEVRDSYQGTINTWTNYP